MSDRLGDFRLVDAALEKCWALPAEQRETFLRRELAARPDLLSAALSALGPGEEEPALEQLAPELLASIGREVQDGEDRRLAGRRLGPWRILGVLGHGGMGAVYLAERADGAFDKKVAIKLLPLALHNDDLIRRFERERQIVAGLSHPGIAQLLDGGTTEDGSPYLVLEYIEGEPITVHADRLALDCEARIRLLIEVCKAVQAAHRNLVVHRDLKPANILVDAGGRARLLDFGIARLLADSGEDRHTEPLGARLTPDYAAPEQLTGEPISTATDVYALGCLLYRLIGGRVPLEVADQPLAQMLKVLDRAERPRLGEAACHPLPPGIRRADFDADLDAIAHKAVAREPERRYGSAAELAEDLARLLESQPVQARAEGTLYRAGKFIARHRLGLSATAAAFVLLAATAGIAIFQADQAARQRDEALAMASMLEELMQLANPDIGMGHQINAHAVLGTALERAAGELPASPETRIRLLETLAEALLAFELADDGLRARRMIHELKLERFGADHPETLAALRLYAVALREQRGDFDECERLFAGLLEARRAHLGEAHPDTAESYWDLGFLYLRYSDNAHAGRHRALELIGRAHEIYRATLGEDHLLTGWALFNLGLATAEAELKIERMRRGIEIHERHAGPGDLQLFHHLGDLAMVLSEAGQVEEGLEMGRRAVEGHQAARGELHPVSILLQNNLAGMYRDHGLFEEALAEYLRVDELMRAVVPENHFRRAFPQYGIGRSLNALGRPAEAQPYLLAAIEILEHNDSHNLAGITRIELGDCLRAQGRIAEAVGEYEKSLEIYLDRLRRSEQDAQVQTIRQRLATL